MKNNHYLSSSTHINNTIQKVFSEKGSQEIPDVKLICSITHSDRKTVINHLQKWWLHHDFLNDNDVFLSQISAFKKSPLEELALLENFLESLFSQKNLGTTFSERNLTTTNEKNKLLLDIRQKLKNLAVIIRQNETIKNNLKLQLSFKSNECKRLNKRMQMKDIQTKKKIVQIQAKLEAKRKETTALRSLVHSLKKNKKQNKSSIF